MALYPNDKAGKIGFFNSKIAPWTANSTAIGTSSAAVTALGTLIATAETKVAAQIAAEQAAKTATAAANDAVRAMVNAGADIIKSIRAKAATTAGVYELAQLPDPATPAPVTTLGLPHDFKVTLGQDGALTTAFKCANPRASGTIYQVFRALNDETDFSYLGSTGQKKFVDATVPAGTAKLMYKVQAVRSTAQGPAAVLTVLIGVGASGQLAASVAQQPAEPKLAA